MSEKIEGQETPTVGSAMSDRLERCVYSQELTQWGWEKLPLFWTYRENDKMVLWGIGKSKVAV